MRQAIMIDGIETPYTLETENICAVLGFSYIYTQVTFEDTLRVVYLGLASPHGYTSADFVAAVLKGQVHTSKRRGHYPLSAVRQRLIVRVRQINKDFVNRPPQ